MIGQYTKGRVYVFVDAANILYSQQSLGWRVDYKKLLEYFKNVDLFHSGVSTCSSYRY